MCCAQWQIFRFKAEIKKKQPKTNWDRIKPRIFSWDWNMQLQFLIVLLHVSWLHTRFVCASTSSPFHFCPLESSFYLNLYGYMHSLNQLNLHAENHPKKKQTHITKMMMMMISSLILHIFALCVRSSWHCSTNSFVFKWASKVIWLWFLFWQQHNSVNIKTCAPCPISPLYCVRDNFTVKSMACWLLFSFDFAHKWQQIYLNI